MTKQPIQLAKGNYIAAGAYCYCYRHPEESAQCIKIPTDNKKSKKRLRADLAYYKKLHAKNTDLYYIADYLGACQTSQGTGYIFELIADHDQKVSKTLEHYLNSESFDAHTTFAELHKLAVYLLKNAILISDIHAKNILLQISPNLPPKPVIVDGIGDTVAFTVLNVLKSEVRSKIIRRWNRFIDLTLQYYPHYSESLRKSYLSKQHLDQ